MRVLAVDPGYERLGIAVLEKNNGGKETLLYSTCFKTQKTLPHYKRLHAILKEMRKTIEDYTPQRLSIETLLFNSNQKTALKVAEARGVILACAAEAHLSIYEYTPLQIKVAVTGYGRSDKEQVIVMIKKLITVPERKAQDDEYDAIACGLTCLATEK